MQDKIIELVKYDDGVWRIDSEENRIKYNWRLMPHWRWRIENGLGIDFGYINSKDNNLFIHTTAT